MTLTIDAGFASGLDHTINTESPNSRTRSTQSKPPNPDASLFSASSTSCYSSPKRSQWRKPSSQPSRPRPTTPAPALFYSTKRMFRAIRRWFRPSVRDGYTRLEWHDEDEEEYWDDWDCKESVLSNFTAHIQQQGFVLTNPTTMITSTSHHTGTYTPTAAPVGTPSFAPTPQTAFSGPLAPPSLDQAVFLYLCINTSSTDTELGEIMIADSTGRSRIRNDRELFDAIREKYNSMKRKGVFSWMYTPKDIHYVRFDVCRDLVGIVEKPKSFPPPLEVSMRRYSFAEPPMTAETFYQLYWKHEKYNKPTVAWLPYLPKKLGTSIPVDIDQREFGWGVHIIEGTDERMTAWVAAIGIMLSLAVAVIYNAKTKGDMGWTIAAWMTIVQAIVMAASYWHYENR